MNLKVVQVGIFNPGVWLSAMESLAGAARNSGCDYERLV